MGWLDIVDTLGGADVLQCTNCMLVPLQYVAMLTSGLMEGVVEVVRNAVTGCLPSFDD